MRQLHITLMCLIWPAIYNMGGEKTWEKAGKLTEVITGEGTIQGDAYEIKKV